MSRNGAVPEREHPPFSVVMEESADGLRLLVRGDLDLASTREFERAVATARRSHPASMIVDLSELAFLDSRGLRAILAAREACEAQGCELMLIAGEQSRRLFDMTGLTDSLPLISRDASEG
jgi:anti-sigma B factor antagonist